MSKNSSRAERRRLKREQHRAEQRSGSFKLAFLVLIVVVIGIAAVWVLNKPSDDVPNNEVKAAIMSSKHTSNTEDVTYNSNPPTSGPHFSDWHKDWAFYESELPVGGLIHNMEHGGIVVWYQSSVDEETKAQLKAFTEDNFKTIASIKEDLPSPIALSAWGVYELFDAFDEAGMKRFYKKHLNHAPENVYP